MIAVGSIARNADGEGRRTAPQFADDVLPDGVGARWASSGDSVLAATGTSPLTTVILTGGPDSAVTVRIEARGRIGTAVAELGPFDVDLEPDGVAEFPLDLRSVTALHPKQSDYATFLRARASVLRADGSVAGSLRLPVRHLAIREDHVEVFDATVFAERYADGITTEEERTRVTVRVPPLAPDEVLIGIGPGVYRTRPLAEAGAVDAGD